MNWPFVTRSAHDALAADRQRVIAERDDALEDLGITGRAFDCIAIELDQAKHTIAHHIVANGDAALRDELALAGVDMRLHLADAEKKGTLS